MPEAPTAVLCACGHRLLCEVRTEGERFGILGFFDDEPNSQTRGECVVCCPGCGRKLELHLLRARKHVSPGSYPP